MAISAEIRKVLIDQLAGADAKTTPLFMSYSGGKKPTQATVSDIADLVSIISTLQYVVGVLVQLVDQ
jgi:hypothetical protein